ncbi:hypothetical protein LSAT2_019378, partial [Lamellibrachia satsuma]
MSDSDVGTRPSRFLRAFLSKSMESFRPKTIARLARRSLRGRRDAAPAAASDSLKTLHISELSRKGPHNGTLQGVHRLDDIAG